MIEGTIKVTLLDVEEGDDGWDFPSKLVEIKNWAEKYIQETPVEYREDIKIEAGSIESWGSSYATMELYYYRPKTEEELEAEQSQSKLIEKRAREQRKATFERLLQEFGKNS